MTTLATENATSLNDFYFFSGWQETPEGLTLGMYFTHSTIDNVQKIVEWCHEHIGTHSSDFEWVCEVDRLYITEFHLIKSYYSIADLREACLDIISYLRFKVTIPKPEHRVMFKLVWDGVAVS